MSISRKNFFTVLTPTYNRGHTLERVYESLEKQSFRDFEWLIVDDGSTDNTREIVEKWQSVSTFPIRYVWQKNQHKKTAFNRGVQEAWGQFLVALDSDDALEHSTLDALYSVWVSIPDDERDGFFAVTGLCAKPDGKVVGDAYPEDVLDMTSLDMYFKHKVRGEKFGCMKIEILKRFPFPDDIEGFVPESLVWRAIARAGYLTRFVNIVMRVYHDSADSLSNQSNQSASRHAMGLILLARDTLVKCSPWFKYNPKEFFMAAIRYTRFRLHLKGTQLPEAAKMSGILGHLLVALMYPAAYLLYKRDCSRQ